MVTHARMRSFAHVVAGDAWDGRKWTETVQNDQKGRPQRKRRAVVAVRRHTVLGYQGVFRISKLLNMQSNLRIGAGSLTAPLNTLS